MGVPDWIAIDGKPDLEADTWDEVQTAVRRYLALVTHGQMDNDTLDDMCRDAEAEVLQVAMAATRMATA